MIDVQASEGPPEGEHPQKWMLMRCRGSGGCCHRPVPPLRLSLAVLCLRMQTGTGDGPPPTTTIVHWWSPPIETLSTGMVSTMVTEAKFWSPLAEDSRVHHWRSVGCGCKRKKKLRQPISALAQVFLAVDGATHCLAAPDRVALLQWLDHDH